MNDLRQGLLVILSAPSGAGKSTICKRILASLPGISESVSYTTRKPRSGEKEGVHYTFISQDKFLEMRSEDQFAECAEVHGEYYGTSKERLKKILDSGEDVLLDIDVQGAMALKKRYPGALMIFIQAPSMEALERRLRSRGSESEGQIQLRLETARKEISFRDKYDYVVFNKNLEDAITETINIIKRKRKETLRP